MSTIELKWRDRKIGGAQTPRKFLDFVVDGNSIYEQLDNDLISPLGWLSSNEDQKAINRLLLIEPADFPNNRRSIYVCPECGDLGCGAVSALVESVGDQIIWREFGYENNYDEHITFDGYEKIGPFSFQQNEYKQSLQSALIENS